MRPGGRDAWKPEGQEVKNINGTQINTDVHRLKIRIF
jgi:hypothetical protein